MMTLKLTQRGTASLIDANNPERNLTKASNPHRGHEQKNTYFIGLDLM